MNLNKYINNISALQLSQILRFGALILISIIFTKIGLSVHDIGVYERLFVISGVLSFFWLNGIIQGMLPISGKKNSNEKSPEFYQAFLLTFVLSLTAAFAGWLGEPLFCKYFNNSNPIDFYYLIVLYVVLNGPASLNEYFYLLSNKSKKLISYSITTFIMQVACVSIPAFAGLGIKWSLAGLVLVAGLKFTWTLFLLVKYSELKYNSPFIKKLISVSLPLVGSAFLAGIAQYIDDFLVSFHSSAAMFAIYKYGAREFPLVLLLATAFSNAMVPEFARLNNNELVLNKIKKNTLRLMHLLFPVTIAMAAVSYWAYPIIFNSGFKASSLIFNIYLLLIISRLIFPQTILTGLVSTKSILLASVLELSVHVVLSIVLVILIGPAGVAIATVIAYLIEKALLVYFCQNKFNIKPSQYIPVKTWLSYSLALIAVFAVYAVLSWNQLINVFVK